MIIFMYKKKLIIAIFRVHINKSILKKALRRNMILEKFIWIILNRLKADRMLDKEK